MTSVAYGIVFPASRGVLSVPRPPLLDSISAVPTAAYSTRQLRAAYAGSCLRARRSSDNTEQDIGFSGGDLDTASLLAFAGAGDAFVTKWYDQSGNARNQAQSTAANQPQLVSSGAITTLNGRPALSFNGSSHCLIGTATLGAYFSVAAYTLCALVRPTAGGSSATNLDHTGAIFADPASDYYVCGFGSAGLLAGHWNSGQLTTSVAGSFPATYVVTHRYDHAHITGYLNGGAGASLTNSIDIANATEPMGIGKPFFSDLFAGPYGELLTFNTPLSNSDMNIIGASQAARGGATWSTI